MERVVALKVMSAECMRDARAVERFEREARAAARLSHPNIVAAHDADEADGLRFLVTEFIDGEDLSDLERRRRPVPVADAIDYIQQAARGLDYAHAHGVVHRDIKPSNLLLDKSGTVKILDMGLARVESEGDLSTQAELTGTSTVLGTVDYMAPEQALSAKRADARSDIYSLGCTLYRLLIGHEPFPGDTVVQKIMAHRNRAVPSLRATRPEVPVELDALFAQMLAKQPSDRPQRALDVVERLEICKRAMATAARMPRPALDATVQWIAEDKTRRISDVPEPSPDLHASPPPPRRPAQVVPPEVPKPRPIANQGGAQPAAAVAAGGHGNRRGLTLGLSAAGGFLLLLGIWSIVRDKRVPEQGSASVVDHVAPPTPTATSASSQPRLNDSTTPAVAPAQPSPTPPPPPVALASASPPRMSPTGTASTNIPSSLEPFDDRSAAEWILRRGGYVEILAGGLARTIRDPARLPSGPFRLIGMFGSAFVDIPITADDLRRLAPLKLRKMYFERAGLTDAHLPLIVDNPELRELVVFQNYGVTDRGVELIKRCTELEVLSVQRTRTTNVGIAHLAPLTKLRKLMVSDTAVTDSGLAVLANFPELEDLQATWCPITGAFAVHLAKSKIKILAPGGPPTRIDREGMAAIASLPTLEWLNLGGTDPIEPEWFAPLAKHPNLKRLEIYGCKLDDRIFTYLIAIPQLLDLNLDATLTTPQGIAEFKRIKPSCRISGVPTPVASPQPSPTGLPKPSPIATRTTVAASSPAAPIAQPTATASAAGTAPVAAVAPFTAEQARPFQAAWARHLGRAIAGEGPAKMTMVLIPPGEFLMGSTDAQVKSALDFSPSLMTDSRAQARVRDGERPQHRVVLTKPYLLGVQEVSIGQFRKFVEATKYVTEAEKFGFGDSDATEPDDETPAEDKTKNWRTPGYATSELSPVTQVTWNDAVAYCNWLSGEEKLTPAYRLDVTAKNWVRSLAADGYRLPTEAEWEFACRAGSTTHFWFGDDPKLADDFVLSERNAKDRAARSDTKPSNPFGLYGMLGGVWEWCQDGYDWRYYAVSPEKDPPGAQSPFYRVVRGGDRFESSVYCRSAARVNQALTFRGRGVGFRVARNVSAAP